MQLVKTFSLLILLLWGNTGFASTPLDFPHPVQDEEVSFQYIEGQQSLAESILNAPVEIQKNRIYLPAYLPPAYECPRKVSRVGTYIVYSRTIIPSLDVTSIIFPFHSFL